MEMPPPAISKPTSLRSHVENFLREAITEGRFQPGERLRERELCEMLEISRPSLREALRKLEAEKLVTTVLHRGPVVAQMTLREATDLYAIRALMEGYAAHEFTRSASDEDIAHLGQAVQALREASGKKDRKLLLKAKARFYDVILDGCGNLLVKEMLLNLLSRISLLRGTSFSRPDRLSQSLREIDALYAHIRERNADAAQLAAQEHIRNAEKSALEVLRKQIEQQNLQDQNCQSFSTPSRNPE